MMRESQLQVNYGESWE